MTTSGSKTLTTFIPFHNHFDYWGRLTIIKDSFPLQKTMLWPFKYFRAWFV